MYCNFLGLRCLPFEDQIDTRFLYLSPSSDRLLASLEHEAHHGHGVTPVFGEEGSGKTLLARALVSCLHASDHVAVVTCPRSGEIDLVREVCKSFGVTISPSENRTRYMTRLRRQLARNAEADHRSILIVDQVEHLSVDNFSAIDALAGLHNDHGHLLTIFFFGHSHVRERLSDPQFNALVQQFAGTHTIVPLTLAETQAYIEHRLTTAGSADPDLFAPQAVILIHSAAKGNPRVINRLCHAALLNAYRKEEKRVGEATAATVTTDYVKITGADYSSLFTESAVSTSPASLPICSYEEGSEASAGTQLHGLSTELGGLVGKGEGLVDRLESLLSRVESTSAGAGYGEGLAQAAENRLVDLLDKVERACDLAGQTESRLSGFAEQLAEKAEIVQRRMGRLMENIQAGEVLQEDIQKTVRQASSQLATVSDQINTEQQSLVTAISDAREFRVDLVTKANEEIDAQKQSLETALSAARKFQAKFVDETWDACRTRISENFEEQRLKYNELVQQARHELQEVAGELTERARESQSQSRDAIDNIKTQQARAEQAERDRTKSVEEKIAALTRAAEDRVTTWENGLNRERKKLERSQDEWKEQVELQLAAAREAQTDLEEQFGAEDRARHASANAIESRLKTVMDQVSRTATEAKSAIEQETERAKQRASSMMTGLESDCEALLAKQREEMDKLVEESDGLSSIVSANREVVRQACLTVEQRLREAKTLSNELTADTDLVDRKLADHKAAFAVLTKAINTAHSQLDGEIDRVNLTRTDLMDLLSRGEYLIADVTTATDQVQSLHQNVTGCLAEICSAYERISHARQQAQAADELIARLVAAASNGENIGNELAKTLKEATEAQDTIARMNAEAANKIGQLDSHTAAATHILGQLCETNIEGHGVLERTAEAIKNVREIGENTKHETELMVEEVQSVMIKTEAATGELAAGNEHAVEMTKQLEKVIHAANGVSGELEIHSEKAKKSTETLHTHCGRADTLVERMESVAESLEGARQIETVLVESIDQARAIHGELQSTSDEVILQQTQLDESRLTATDLIDTQNKLELQAQESLAQLEDRVADAQDAANASDRLLTHFTKHCESLRNDITTLGQRATGVEESLDRITAKPSAIVAKAQVQAAQLEKVCAAVQKVFAELSKASLEANNQTTQFHQASETALDRLGQLHRETNCASQTLQRWVEKALRIGAGLVRTSGSSSAHLKQRPEIDEAVLLARSGETSMIANFRADETDRSETESGRATETAGVPDGGEVLKTAQAPRSIENPAAHTITRKSTREQEIAGMIADAKATAKS